MIEDEIERINKAIVKREKALAKGDESKAKSIEEELAKEGFEIRDTKDITYVNKKKKANI